MFDFRVVESRDVIWTFRAGKQGVLYFKYKGNLATNLTSAGKMLFLKGGGDSWSMYVAYIIRGGLGTYPRVAYGGKIAYRIICGP